MYIFKCQECQCEFDVIGPTRTLITSSSVAFSAPVGFSMPKEITILDVNVKYCPACAHDHVQLVPKDKELRERLGFND